MTTRAALSQWTVLVPLLAVVTLAATWGRELPGAVVVVVAIFLAGAVLAAVHHAEVVAHKVGEPYGSLVLAVAVTLIEVGLILTLSAGGGDKTASLARDTVFAAVMITVNGIMGLSLVISALHQRIAVFNATGVGAALSTVATLATLCLVLPTVTTGGPGLEFTPAQLAFAAVASLTLWGLFVAMQTVRHRDYFLPPDASDVSAAGGVRSGDPDEEVHAAPPTGNQALLSLALLLVALLAVVGNAKGISPAIEDGVSAAGFPPTVVGIVIALLVLLPETLAAANAARRGRVQISLNLALGSAMASIGLTIPAIAISTIWIDGPLLLGLSPTEIVLLALTFVVGILTVVPGRATLLQGYVHLAVFFSFLFLAVSP
jgi:Ca2+:H+ antiporter